MDSDSTILIPVFNVTINIAKSALQILKYVKYVKTVQEKTGKEDAIYASTQIALFVKKIAITVLNAINSIFSIQRIFVTTAK